MWIHGLQRITLAMLQILEARPLYGGLRNSVIIDNHFWGNWSVWSASKAPLNWTFEALRALGRSWHGIQFSKASLVRQGLNGWEVWAYERRCKGPWQWQLKFWEARVLRGVQSMRHGMVEWDDMMAGEQLGHFGIVLRTKSGWRTVLLEIIFDVGMTKMARTWKN